MVYAKDTLDNKFGTGWVSLERSRENLAIKNRQKKCDANLPITEQVIRNYGVI